MLHEQLARERKEVREQINDLKKKLSDMESDFAECARTRKSPCFFCANDDTCDAQTCNFKWQAHN